MYPEPILNAKNRELQTYCNSISLLSTLMLGFTCTIHLGIQWPRIQCSRACAQPQHGRLQGLFPTLPIYLFMCSRASCSTQISQKSCDPEILAQHKHKLSCSPELLTWWKYLNTHVLYISSLNTRHLINHVL